MHERLVRRASVAVVVMGLGAGAPPLAMAAPPAHSHSAAPDAAQQAATAEPPAWATRDARVGELYRWVARNREALQYMPCACGCEAGGHANNWNCFVQSEPKPGRYVWDQHGLYCSHCQDIAIDTRRMLGAGMMLPAIRRAIDAKHGPFTMDTPRPPERP